MNLENITNIIQGCRRNEERYQKLLFERFKGFALKTVFRYIYRYDVAVDVMHDAFVKVFKNFFRFTLSDSENPEPQLMGWIKRIMINTAIDKLRKGNMLPEIGGIPEYVWDQPDKHQEADQMLLYKDLIVLIKNLPPSYRAVFNLYVIDGYNHFEIADLLQIAPGTSKSSLSRARTLLQQQIKKLEQEKLCRI